MAHGPAVSTCDSGGRPGALTPQMGSHRPRVFSPLENVPISTLPEPMTQNPEAEKKRLLCSTTFVKPFIGTGKTHL